MRAQQQANILLKTLLEQGFSGLAVLSMPDLKFRFANRVYVQALPGEHNSIIGRAYGEVWPDQKGYPCQARLTELLAGQPPYPDQEVIIQHARSGQQSYTLRICALNWQDAPAVLLIMQPTLVDPAHWQSRELNTILMAMADVVMIFGAHGQTTHANQAAAKTFGIEPLGMHRLELMQRLKMQNLDGQPLPVDQLPCERAMRGEVVTSQEVLVVDASGKARFFLVSASPMRNEVGPVGVVTVWHDVSDRENLIARLETEQSRLATIIENAPQAILVADEEGRLVQANPAAERMLVRPLPYGLDYPALSELQICKPGGQRYTARSLPLVAAALNEQRQSNDELLVLLPDGQRRSILSSTAPIIDRKGNLKGAISILQDITLSKRAEEELRIQAGRSQLLASLSQAFAETGLNQNELLETIVREIGGISGDMSFIQLVMDEGKWSRIAAFSHPNDAIQRQAWAMLRPLRLTIDEGELGQIGSTGRVVRLSRASLEDLQQVFPAQCQPAVALLNVSSALFVPLRAHGRWIGNLGIMRSQHETHYNMEDQFFYQDLADRAALALEDARLYEQEARRLHELSALHQATTALLSTIDLEALLLQILDAAQTAIPATGQGVLYLLAPGTGSLEVRALTAFRDPRIHKVSMHHIQGLAAQAVREKRSILSNQIAVDAVIDPALDTLADKAMAESGQPNRQVWASAIIAPLMMANRVLGALSLASPQAGQFHESDLRLLNSFAATATAALNNATLHAEVQRLATTDTLTELYNRRRFFELGELEMHRFRRYKQPLSAIMLDLDNFKAINDTYGHGAGDEVLFTVSRRIQESIRVVDILGRYGGDEFAILLPDANMSEAHIIAERIRKAVLTEPVQPHQGQIAVAISLGIAEADDENDTLAILMARADAALYEAKQTGRNRVVDYHSEISPTPYGPLPPDRKE